MKNNIHYSRKSVLLTRLLSATLVCVFSFPAMAQDDFGFAIEDAEVKREDNARYDDAKQMLADEQYTEALAAFEEIQQNDDFKKVHESAAYDAAKTLFRMELYHSALTRFGTILKAGPKHPFFVNSQEWLFYIARRIDDRQRVVEMIANFVDPKDIPKEYSDELNYQLAQYHFLNALDDSAWVTKDDGGDEDEENPFDFSDSDIGVGSSPPEKESPRQEDDDDGGFDFSEDDLGGGDDDGFSIGDVDVETDEKEDYRATKVGSSKESLEQALKNIAAVSEGYNDYSKTLYLKGLVYYAQEKFEPSVKAFREVVRMTNPEKGSVNNPRLREMAFFSLARVHYQFEQFRYAIFYYERVSRDSEAWLDSLFESSWAHFRLGKYEKALGNLVTIQSPFFQDEYYPESHILKAITFYENCRYPEARSFLTQFNDEYQGVIDELGRLLGKDRDPVEIFEELSSLEAKMLQGEGVAEDRLTARILRLSFADKRLATYKRSIQEVESEIARLEALSAPFSGMEAQSELIGDVRGRRTGLVKKGGKLLANKLKTERRTLKELSGKLVRIEFEITKSEKVALEDSLQGTSNRPFELPEYKFSTATDDERQYWPFSGEYWRDELGTYEYTLTHGCREVEEEG